MAERILPALIGVALLVALSATGGAPAAGRFSLGFDLPQPVIAQACLSQRQIRAAVQSGAAIPLSRLISSIRATVAGQVLPQPQLCRSGGRLVYLINVLSGNGQVQQLTIDAGSGTILGY